MRCYPSSPRPRAFEAGTPSSGDRRGSRRPHFGLVHQPFGSALHPFDPIHEPAGSLSAHFDPIPPSFRGDPPRFDPCHGRFGSISPRRGSSPPHFGSISPGARPVLACFGSAHARARSIDGRFGSFHELVDRGYRSIGWVFGRSVCRFLASVRFLLPSILISPRTGARRLRFGSIPPQFGSSSPHFGSIFTPSRTSRLPRGSSDQTARRESPRTGS
jgi:hypothetical protein